MFAASAALATVRARAPRKASATRESEWAGTPDPAYQNQITTLAQLPRFLTDLRLTGNPLTAPVSVSSRTGLRKLYVSDTQVSNLAAERPSGLTPGRGLER